MTLLTNMAINNNSKKSYTAQACYVAGQCKNSITPVFSYLSHGILN